MELSRWKLYATQNVKRFKVAWSHRIFLFIITTHSTFPIHSNKAFPNKIHSFQTVLIKYRSFLVEISRNRSRVLSLCGTWLALESDLAHAHLDSGNPVVYKIVPPPLLLYEIWTVRSNDDSRLLQHVAGSCWNSRRSRSRWKSFI